MNRPCPDPFATPAEAFAAPTGRVLRFAGFRRAVSDLQRATAFYCDGLGFQRAAQAAASPPAARTQTLRLGDQAIELIEAADTVFSTCYAQGVIDTGFQHLAIVAADMDAACERLRRCAPVAISRGGPVTLPATAGGVVAFKFLDPDGHPLELIHFPSGTGAPVWQHPDASGPTLGIDHSAIVVADSDRSIAFYRDLLGFKVAARQLNHGQTQQRLDGVDGARVEVIALEPALAPTPHLELLGYRGLRSDGQRHGRQTDGLVWWCDDPEAIVKRGAPLTAEPVGPVARCRSNEHALCDPDGHLHVLARAPS